LPYVIDVSHATPTTHVNRGLKLLKLTEGDIIHALSGFRTYLGPWPILLALNQAVPLGTTVTVY